MILKVKIHCGDKAICKHRTKVSMSTEPSLLSFRLEWDDYYLLDLICVKKKELFAV